MFKRYFLLTIAMLVVAAGFVQVANAQVTPPPVPIHFDSEPPLTGEVGVPYVYTVHLDGVDSTEAVIRYGVDRLDPPALALIQHRVL